MNDHELQAAQAWAALHFEHRQQQWVGNIRTFKQHHGRTDRLQVWECWVVGDTYYTRHGLAGGKMQETSKRGKAKNVGKANELTPEADALSEARRLCRKRWDFEGYDEYVGDMNIDQRTGTPSVPHLLVDLPGSFSLFKPHNNIHEAKTLWKKAKAGGCLYGLKRNGLAMWVVVDCSGGIHMYSRRNRKSHKDEGPKENDDGTMDWSNVIPWTTRFPHLAAAVQSLNLPPNSMMACELVHPEGDTKRHFAHVQGVEKSLTPRALQLQQEGGWLMLYWWDLPFLNGEDLVSHKRVSERYSLIKEIHHRAAQVSDQPGWIQPIAVHTFLSPESAEQYAKANDLEGWVVVDPEGIYGDKGWNLKGKPDRPKSFCAKLKPWYEDDFVVLWDPDNGWGTYGKGKHEPGKRVTLPSGQQATHGGVGSVGLGQYNNRGELVKISDCSSGMDFEFQARLTVRSFPMVWEVKYTERSYQTDGDATNALTFPGFVRVRTDKDPKECVNERL